MIDNVTKLKNGEYLINNNIKIKNIDYDEECNYFTYDIEYNDKKYTETETYEICEHFLYKAITNY